MGIVALICARGGSKGVPGKNLKALGGRPLVGWSVAHAQAVARVDRVIVSTDSPAIAEAARAAGAEVPFWRPAELATDQSAEWLVWRHALSYLRSESGAYPDVLMVVPPTAPLREPSDLERCLDEYARGAVDVVVTVTEAHRNPYFNMVQTGSDGYATLVCARDGSVARRQEAPVVYDMTTVCYVARPAFVIDQPGIFSGRVRAVIVPPERALDIDSLLDFQIAEWMVTHGRDSGGADRA